MSATLSQNMLLAVPLAPLVGSVIAEMMKEISTPRMVSMCAPRRPITLPNKPAAIEPTSGARGTASSELRESSDIVVSLPISP